MSDKYFANPAALLIATMSCLLLIAQGCAPVSADGDPNPPPSTSQRADADVPVHAGETNSLGRLKIWDDGLSEMCYFDATDRIYDTERRYTRVTMVNREWLDPTTRVKSDRPITGGDNSTADQRTAVLKLNIAEEIPTENYNYRLLVTVFLNRDTLELEKLTASSQEWCGATFSQWIRQPGGLVIRSFSYFDGEADQTRTLENGVGVYPPDALLLIARNVVANSRDVRIRLGPKVRSNHAATDLVLTGLVSRAESLNSPFECAAGQFDASRVSFTDESGSIRGTFVIESAVPCRLLSYDFHDGTTGTLRFCERRAYWDRNWPSRYYPKGAAP